MTNRFNGRKIWVWNLPLALLASLLVALCLAGIVVAQEQVASGEEDQTWIEEIEKIFIPSEQCKQCHDRHYEEWKGMREQTMDLKTFGRVDGALLHGTALTSPVFRTVFIGSVASNQAGLRTTYSVPIVSSAICDRIPPAYGSDYCPGDEGEEACQS
jgi:hypothetical protein